MAVHAREYAGTYFGSLMVPHVAVTRGDDPTSVIANARRSRRQLATAYFALGIDALSHGDTGPACDYFALSVEDGFAPNYVCHLSRALHSRIVAGGWPDLAVHNNELSRQQRQGNVEAEHQELTESID